MSGRSPSGVASLRARFEHGNESNSPPSRGRSPAGSFTSDTSRPISKVRTSFVSVEGSGRMGDQLHPKDPEGSVIGAGEGAEESKGDVNSESHNGARINGETSHEPKKSGSNDAGGVVQSEPKNADPSTITNPTSMDGTSDANPDKPVSAAEENTAGMLPADPKDEAAVSGGAALANDNAELGSILKGSPFEQDKGKKASPSKTSKAKAATAQSHPPTSQSRPSTTSGLANGNPKGAPARKPAVEPKAKDVGSANHTDAKLPASSNDSDKTRNLENKSKPATQPAAIDTASASKSGPPTEKEAGKGKPDKKTPTEPRTPTSANASTKQPFASKASPKPGKAKEPKKELEKDPKKTSAQQSAASRPPPAVAAKQPPSSSTKLSKPASPKSTFTKPRPKSPTRPARLPPAATAPTAASAAKLDGAPPVSHDRRPLASSTAREGKAPPNAAKPQPRSARTSLPVGSKSGESLKVARPRQSMASSKGSDGSFLDRMMRPTQSSSQKTHEKVEAKTPPKKLPAIKPKRVSGGSNTSKTEGETKPESTLESASESAVPQQPTVPEGTADGASVSASAAAHTVPPTIPVP